MPTPFTFSLNTSTIRCGNIPLEKKIEIAGKAGYDSIEPWVSEIDEYAKKGGNLDDLAKRFKDNGLTVANLIGFFEWAAPDEALRTKGMGEARRCFQMAQRVGCRKVAAPPWGIHTTPGLNLFEIAERYAKVIDLGKPFGVTPVLEFWGVAKTLGHLGEALLIAAECGKPEACILADVFHIFKSSGHFDGLRLLGPNSLGLVHVNDYPGEPEPEKLNDSHRVYPGDGVAPLKQIFKTLKEVGYRGTLSLELFNEEYWKQDPLTVAKTGLKKMKALAR